MAPPYPLHTLVHLLFLLTHIRSPCTMFLSLHHSLKTSFQFVLLLVTIPLQLNLTIVVSLSRIATPRRYFSAVIASVISTHSTRHHPPPPHTASPPFLQIFGISGSVIPARSHSVAFFKLLNSLVIRNCHTPVMLAALANLCAYHLLLLSTKLLKLLN